MASAPSALVSTALAAAVLLAAVLAPAPAPGPATADDRDLGNTEEVGALLIRHVARRADAEARVQIAPEGARF